MQMQNSSFKRRPKWSLKTSFWIVLSIIIFSIISAKVLNIIGLKSTITLYFEATFPQIFIFIFIILYYGVVFNKNEKFEIKWKKKEPNNIDINLVDYNFPLTAAAAESGIVEAIIGFILEVILILFISYIFEYGLSAGIEIVYMTSIMLIIPLFWIYSRSIRYAIVFGKKCKGRIINSIIFSIFYALLGSLTYCVIIEISKFVFLKL